MVDSIPNISNRMEKTAKIEQCLAKIRTASGYKRSFKMEIRLVQDSNERRKYESRLTALGQMLKSLQADCKALESELVRGELFVQADEQATETANGLDGVKAGDAMLKEAHHLQDKTQDSLSNTKQLIAESKQVGVETLEELQRQRQVLENIDRETDRVNDNLARSELLLKQFGKRMASDHFIQCFAVINCLLLVGVVLYAVLGKRGDDDNTDSNNNVIDPTGAVTRWLLRH
jgi:hypothetical protein